MAEFAGPGALGEAVEPCGVWLSGFGGWEALDGLEYFLEVGAGVYFRLVPDDFAIADEEGLAGGEADAHGGDSEGLDDIAFRVGDELEGEFVFLLEGLLGFGFVHADAEDGDAFGLQFVPVVAEGAGLFGAAGGIGFRVEVDEDEAFFPCVCEADFLIVLVACDQRGCVGTWLEGIGPCG